MFGLEVLSWHVSAQENNSLASIIKKYIFGDVVSHTAIKITIPSTPLYDDLVRKYCLHIPHFRTFIKIPEKTDGSISHRPVEVPAWQIYFSRWPGKLAREYEDKISASFSTKHVIDEKWAPFFEKEKITASRGMLGYWLGKTLFDFCFGKPEKIPEPLLTIVHPHPEQQQWWDRINTAINKHLYSHQETIEVLEASYKKNNALFVLFRKIEHLQARYDNFYRFMTENEQIEMLDRLTFELREAETLMKELEDLKKVVLEKEMSEEKAKQERILLENIFYSQIATIGCQPSRCNRLPISEIHYSGKGLSLEPMLQVMQDIALNDGNFNMATNNCSNAVFDILFAGMSALARQQLISAKCMHESDFVYPLLACPEKVHRFTQKLETAWMTFELSSLLTTVPQLNYQVDPKTMHLTRAIPTETSGPQLRTEQKSSLEKKIGYRQA